MDYITKRAKAERKIINIVDNFTEDCNDENFQPKECWHKIENRLLEQGLTDREDTIFAKSYFSDIQLQEEENAMEKVS